MSSDEEEETTPRSTMDVQEGGKSEAALKMEEKARKDKERVEAELQEYYEQRKEEKEKMELEISELKQKRALRLSDRAEEERRMNEQRQAEDHRRREEEAERQRKKQDEADRKRAEREAKRMEAEERSKNMGKRNFAITRKTKSGEIETISGDEKSTDQAKSKEQVEAEKKAILDQRITPLGDINSLDEDGIKTKAKELHQQLQRLESDKYDLEQHYKQRQYEMNDLADRARQMSKGKKKSAQLTAEADPLAERYSGIPPKILICSKYERHTDRRTYGERKTVFVGPIYAEEVPRIKPSWEREAGEAEAVEGGGEK